MGEEERAKNESEMKGDQRMAGGGRGADQGRRKHVRVIWKDSVMEGRTTKMEKKQRKE